jgi:DNA-3-methyladenine glycosylase
MVELEQAGRARPLTRSFYRRDVRAVAPALLNKVLVHGRRAARIVEVEAYLGADDAASHAFRGRTARNAVMFGPPGHLYVYFTYGMHWCANVVCSDDGVAQAALLRAAVPLAGLDEMRAARGGIRRDRDLCRGPARLCQALGLSREHDGADLVDGPPGGVYLLDDDVAPPAEPSVSTRIGLRAGADLPLRWFVPGELHLSRPR